MFYPRYGFKASPQKNRNHRMLYRGSLKLSREWTKFFALGQGYMSENFIYKLYI